MTRAAAVRQADLNRALKALARAGFGVARITVRPGGEVEIVAGPAGALTPRAPGAKPVDLDEWVARQNERRAHQGS
jgi:hypothetical protein